MLSQNNPLEKTINAESELNNLKGTDPQPKSGFIGSWQFSKSSRKTHFLKTNKNKNRLNHSTLAQKGCRLFIDHRRTIRFHERDQTIEDFSRSYLKPSPESFTSPFFRVNNFFNILQLSAIQVLIISFPNSPFTLLMILILAELCFILLTLIPFMKNRFIPVNEFANKIIRSVCSGGFYLICFTIQVSHDRNSLQVSENLQQWGIRFISIGIVSTYVFSFYKGFVTIVNAYKKFTKNKSRQKNEAGVEDLRLTHRGLIFYSEFDFSKNNQTPIDKEVLKSPPKKNHGSQLRHLLSHRREKQKSKLTLDIINKNQLKSFKSGKRINQKSWDSIFDGLNSNMEKNLPQKLGFNFPNPKRVSQQERNTPFKVTKNERPRILGEKKGFDLLRNLEKNNQKRIRKKLRYI